MSGTDTRALLPLNPPAEISAAFAIADLRFVDAFDRFLDPAIEIGAQSYRWLESCLWQPLPLQ